MTKTKATEIYHANNGFEGRLYPYGGGYIVAVYDIRFGRAYADEDYTPKAFYHHYCFTHWGARRWIKKHLKMAPAEAESRKAVIEPKHFDVS